MEREGGVLPVKGGKEGGRVVESRATFVKVGEVAAGFKGYGKDPASRKQSISDTEEGCRDGLEQKQEQGPRRGVRVCIGWRGRC